MILLIYIPLFAGLIYWVGIRPQQAIKKREEELHANLEVGDEIVTKSGLYGMVTEFDGGTLFLEVSTGVELKISRDAVSAIVTYDDPSDAEADDDEDA